MSVSLYRKYRPQTFEEVVGQEHVEKTLMNAVATGRPSHAYLFTGPRGTGKTTTARLLAKALLCAKGPTAAPDGTCEQCLTIADGMHPDVYELDAASRTGVDNIREEIISRVKFAPTRGQYKVYIIDEVHMLSTQAFNALLLTLEEPPSHIVFILCTTDVHKVPKTILSRCQRFDFKRLSEEQIAGRLAQICEKEGFTAEPSALKLIAARSQGGMRDAIGALEQVAIFGGGQVRYEAVEDLLGEVSALQLFSLAELVAKRDAAACFSWVASFAHAATDIALFTSEFASHIRNLYAVCVLDSRAELNSIFSGDEELYNKYREQARLFGSADRLAHVLGVLGDLSRELKSAPNARLALEIALTRMVRPMSDLTLESLAARIAVLEQTVSSKQAASASNEQAAPSSAPLSFSSEVKKTPAEYTAFDASPVFASTQQSEPSPEAPHPLKEAAGTHRKWLQAESEIKKKSRTLGMLLSGSEAQIDEERDLLIITLPQGAHFSKKKLEDPANIAQIEEIIRAIFGGDYKPFYVLGSLEAQSAVVSEEVLFADAAEQKEIHSMETTSEPFSDPVLAPEPELGLVPKSVSTPVDQAPGQVPDHPPAQAPDQASDQAPAAIPELAQEELLMEQPAQPVRPATSKSAIETMLSSSLGSTISFEEV